MSQRITVAPFHRRVLPWIFIIAFVIVAPAVVFYTAGYRFNPKKGKVERNGTVILDTTPTGATVSIDGQPYASKTPMTIQDMAPGLHRFDLTKNGYHDWRKSLDVRSELVTFANNVWLWKDSTPQFRSSGSALLVSSAPDHSTVLELLSTTPTQAIVFDGTGAPLETFTLPKKVAHDALAIWAPNGRYVLIETPRDSTESDWLIDTRAAHPPLELPPGDYRWENGTLVGIQNTEKRTVALSTFTVSTVTMLQASVDTNSNAALQIAPGTNQLVYVAHNNPQQGFILPTGNWRFWSTLKNRTMLRDGARWLSLLAETEPPEYRTASGDMLRNYSEGSPRELLVNGTEIWTWDTSKDPQLMYRQSNKIINAEWHTAGYDIFFATEHDVYALNLDPRDGYFTTPLAHFDSITGFTALPKQLYIAGTRNGQTGLWTLDIQ